MHVRYFDSVKRRVLSSSADIVPKNPRKTPITWQLAKRARFEVLQKNPKIMPRVVWAEESKTGLGFKIGPRQQKL